ncbi:hypothetical protein FPZ61_05695 [Synechococcus sp. BSA11S]|uniref:hypothetical protein n=1 Tax=Synechococcales TaxID=1890424 RepID=UPI0016231D3B|nr:hypothetical protein [Synechococcus sp. BSA11S]MBC1263662.1 hypothetical protein [Synechococcus sp. BSA11S]
MEHPQDQLTTAAELLADGVPRKDAADRLAEQFDISQATAYRRLAQAESDAGAERTCRQCFDLGEFIAEQYVQLVRGAADDEAKLNALAGLTSACSKLKLRHLSFDP